MRHVTVLVLAGSMVATLLGAPSALAQCFQNQGDFSAELTLNGGNSNGTYTYVWDITYDAPDAWLTDLYFQSSGAQATSVAVLPEFTTWAHTQVAVAPGTGLPAERFTYQSGLALQSGRTATFAYTTTFTDPVQVRGIDNDGTNYAVSFNSATCANLPVELTSFDARADGDAGLLTWTTASETNNAGFSVEMRVDGGIAFQALGFVAGVGTTAEAQQYRFYTPTLTPGRHLFRLQQVDFDGATVYTDPVELEIAPDGAVFVHPFASTVQDATEFSFTVARADRVQASLYNILGQQVAAVFEGDVAGGETVRASLDVAGLPAGAYFLRIQGSTFGQTERVTVLR